MNEWLPKKMSQPAMTKYKNTTRRLYWNMKFTLSLVRVRFPCFFTWTVTNYSGTVLQTFWFPQLWHSVRLSLKSGGQVNCVHHISSHLIAYITYAVYHSAAAVHLMVVDMKSDQLCELCIAEHTLLFSGPSCKCIAEGGRCVPSCIQ